MLKIVVGARSSALSLVQVKEILEDLHVFYPQIEFELKAVKTIGDRDRTTSLRDLDKSDFFTREVDEMLLSNTCRIAIHSAKDLPDPLPKGLKIVALTIGKDNSDSLVLKENSQLDSLPKGAVIATSSKRREEAVRVLRPDLSFVDIRGTISERLDAVESGKVDGVVIAEAALIRLNFTHLNRVKLPGATTPLQGQLVVIAREDDSEMEKVFAPLDSRKKMLYFGLKVPEELREKAMHYPLIEIAPRIIDDAIMRGIERFEGASHIILTSQSAVENFARLIDFNNGAAKSWVVVGSKTAKALEKAGIKNALVAEEETAEGVVEALKKLDLSKAKVLWPHAARARSLIQDYLIATNVEFFDFILYDTRYSKPPFEPRFETIEELYFTSPSTVDAFIEFFGVIPKDKVIHAIGPITAERVNAATFIKFPTGTAEC